LKNLAVMVSGGGTNFQSVIDGCESGEIGAKIKLCVSSKAGAYALERAAKYNIPSFVFQNSDFGSPNEMFMKIAELFEKNKIDLVILAGYMTVLPAFFVKAFAGKIINIHPSLIPKYSGQGFYGLRVHSAVLAAGEKESGATVHFVDAGVDTGEIILQKKVPVLTGDTPETLAARVLQTEHQILKEAIIKVLKESK
jgi:phosphoribosylglycinamide formyltransferase, formyltetrahydrofolate-dependent